LINRSLDPANVNMLVWLYVKLIEVSTEVCNNLWCCVCW